MSDVEKRATEALKSPKVQKAIKAAKVAVIAAIIAWFTATFPELTELLSKK